MYPCIVTLVLFMYCIHVMYHVSYIHVLMILVMYHITHIITFPLPLLLLVLLFPFSPYSPTRL